MASTSNKAVKIRGLVKVALIVYACIQHHFDAINKATGDMP